MKRYGLLIVTALLTATFMFSQNININEGEFINFSAKTFAPIGAEWYYTERHAFSGDITFLKITSLKDTVLNGKMCRKLEKQSNPMCSGRPDIEFMYQEDGIVHFWDTSYHKFQTLYDFTKNIGEYWIIEVYDNRYPPSERWRDSVIYDPDTIKVTVNQISSIEINGQNLLQLNVTYEVLSEVYPYRYDSKIIEKIGDTRYMFNYYPFSSMACDGNYSAGLRCYEDSEFGLYSTGLADSCDYTYKWVNIEDKEAHPDFKISPNPSVSLLTIETTQPDFYSVHIISLSGTIIYRNNMEGTSKQVDLSAFSKGIYFITVRSKEFVRTEKIIKL